MIDLERDRPASKRKYNYMPVELLIMSRFHLMQAMMSYCVLLRFSAYDELSCHTTLKIVTNIIASTKTEKYATNDPSKTE